MLHSKLGASLRRSDVLRNVLLPQATSQIHPPTHCHQKQRYF